MTMTGEGILVSVSISALLIAFFVSQTDWVKGSGNPSQSHHPGQVDLAVTDGLIPND